MTPSAASLIALAALFAAAAAQDNCRTQSFGDISGYPVQFEETITPPRGGRVTIPDYCDQRYPGTRAVGETVKACNVQPYGAAPYIYLVNPPDLSPVDIVCSDGCPAGASVHITQYCR